MPSRDFPAGIRAQPDPKRRNGPRQRRPRQALSSPLSVRPRLPQAVFEIGPLAHLWLLGSLGTQLEVPAPRDGWPYRRTSREGLGLKGGGRCSRRLHKDKEAFESLL